MMVLPACNFGVTLLAARQPCLLFRENDLAVSFLALQ